MNEQGTTEQLRKTEQAETPAETGARVREEQRQARDEYLASDLSPEQEATLLPPERQRRAELLAEQEEARPDLDVEPPPETPDEPPEVTVDPDTHGDEPPDDPYSEMCATCKGWGIVKTGSIVEGYITRQCEDCVGEGFVRKPLAVEPPPQLQGEPQTPPPAVQVPAGESAAEPTDATVNDEDFKPVPIPPMGS